MKMERRDVEPLRWPLAVASSLVLLAAGAVYSSLDTGRTAKAEHQSALARHAAAEQDLRRLRDEREEIAKRAKLYLRLQDAGLTGGEKRLDWSELLRDLQQQRRLPAMSYQFLPPRPLDGSVLPGFQASSMRLHLELFHEEDLLEFLAGLQRGAGALVLTRSCKLTRRPAGGAEALARLQADCEVDWLTLKGAGS